MSTLLVLQNIQNDQVNAQHEQMKSISLLHELRMSSDDLTKMIRLYTVTAKEKYKDYFNEIINIREGTSPRPVNYESLVYWDLVIEGKRPTPYGEEKPLSTKMLESKLTLNEFEILKEAENNSSELVILEKEAMALIEKSVNTSDNSERKKLREQAQDIVFGASYMKEKAKIMKPINDFFILVKKRISERIQTNQDLIKNIILISIIISILAAIALVKFFLKIFEVLSDADNQNELLLLSILPPGIAKRLKEGENIADEYPQACVLFADIVSFTEKTIHFGPSKMLLTLGELFEQFDYLCEKNKVEKIKTIGDSYMVVSGIPEIKGDHVKNLAHFALDIKQATNIFSQIKGIEIQIRVGMALGKVIGGVMGKKKFIYDIWGDTVNIASRMESTGVNNEIQITEKVAMAISEDFILKERGAIEVKGRGVMKTYFLLSPKGSVQTTVSN